MTPEKFKELIEFNSKGCEESSHIECDAIMCELLKSLGYGEGVKIFENMEKWYA